MVGKVTVPIGNEILVPRRELIQGAVGNGIQRHEVKPLTQLMGIVEALIRHEAQNLFVRMKDDFGMMQLASRAEGMHVLKAPNRDLRQYDRLVSEGEERFMDNFMTLMRRSGFTLLTQSEWDDAKSEDFLVNMPITIPWDRLDDQLLGRMWRTCPNLAERNLDRADFSDRMLVFKRGVGVITRPKGLYVPQKVELLVEYLVINPLLRLMDKFVKHDKAKAALKGFMGRDAGAGAGVDAPGTTTSLAGGAPWTSHGTPILSDIRAAWAFREIERRNFRSLMPGIMAVIAKLFTAIEPSEPTFKSVVVVYRRSKPVENKNPLVPHLRGVHSFDAPDPEDDRSMYYPPALSNLYVEVFRDIPWADLEIAFPDKEVHVSNSSYVAFFVNIVIILASIVALLISTRGRLAYFASPMAALLVRLYTQWAGIKAEKRRIEDALVTMNVLQCTDKQEGAVAHLIELMTEQGLRELLVTYTVLSAADKEAMMPDDAYLTVREVEKKANEHLKKNFGQEAAFKAGWSLEYLERSGVAEKRSVAPPNASDPPIITYRALALSNAMAHCYRRWESVHGHMAPTRLSSAIGQPKVAAQRSVHFDSLDNDDSPAGRGSTNGGPDVVVPGQSSSSKNWLLRSFSRQGSTTRQHSGPSILGTPPKRPSLPGTPPRPSPTSERPSGLGLRVATLSPGQQNARSEAEKPPPQQPQATVDKSPFPSINLESASLGNESLGTASVGTPQAVAMPQTPAPVLLSPGAATPGSAKSKGSSGFKRLFQRRGSKKTM